MIIPEFFERHDYGKESLHSEFWPDLPRDDVMKLLQLLEDMLEITPGRLRPSDPIESVFAPTPTRNPYKWLVRQVEQGDAELELQEELWLRLDAANLKLSSTLRTVDELVRCWCGQLSTLEPSTET